MCICFCSDISSAYQMHGKEGVHNEERVNKKNLATVASNCENFADINLIFFQQNQ